MNKYNFNENLELKALNDRKKIMSTLKLIKKWDIGNFPIHHLFTLRDFAKKANINYNILFYSNYKELRNQIIEELLRLKIIHNKNRMLAAIERIKKGHPIKISSEKALNLEAVSLEAGIKRAIFYDSPYKDILILTKEAGKKYRIAKREKTLLDGIALLKEKFKDSSKITLNNLKKETHISDRVIHTHPNVIKKLHQCRFENTDDVWYFETLGVKMTSCSSSKSMNFSCIYQAWLKEAAKKYIKKIGSTQISVGKKHLYLGKNAVRIFNLIYSSSRYPYALR